MITLYNVMFCFVCAGIIILLQEAVAWLAEKATQADIDREASR